MKADQLSPLSGVASRPIQPGEARPADPVISAFYRAAITRWALQRREAAIIEAERVRGCSAGAPWLEVSEAALFDQGGLDHCGTCAP
jgi:hypothetical protein